MPMYQSSLVIFLSIELLIEAISCELEHTKSIYGTGGGEGKVIYSTLWFNLSLLREMFLYYLSNPELLGRKDKVFFILKKIM